MAVPNHPVPGPSKSVDGMSILPGRALVKTINWRALKRDFLLDPEYTSPREWLANVMMWPREKLLSGNTLKKTTGWGTDKAALEQRRTEVAIEEMLNEQRKRMPDLIKAKLNLVVKIINDVGRWSALMPAEKKLCYEILKTELGETTSIKTVGVISPKDPVEALLERYGLMAEGRIIIDDDEPTESSEVNPAPQAISSGSSTGIPPSPTI